MLPLLILVWWTRCTPLVTKELIAQVKKTATWEVTEYEENGFRGLTFEEAQAMLDSVPPDDPTFPLQSESQPTLEADSTYPDNFDARQTWPECMHRVRNQGRCGASWAMAPTSSMSDRYCIQGNDHMLSPQDLVSCDRGNEGCKGGDLEKAMNRMQAVGAVDETCFPFVSGNEGLVPPCPNYCPVGGQPWTRTRCKRVIHIILNSSIKFEISKIGPVVSRFDVYEDFYLYKNGIYSHQSGRQVGGLAVKVLGWGKEEDKVYWLCQNSWGASWGVGGFFKIKQADCRIDNFFFTCDV